MLRSLLVPLDGSPFGEYALPIAASLARRTDATLHLAHVHHVAAPDSPAGLAVFDVADLHQRQDEQAYLADVTRRVVGKGALRVETTLLKGEVVASLKEIHWPNAPWGRPWNLPGSSTPRSHWSGSTSP
jgi:nucleotide-binding universal stress UspA family protein